jgi:hypothetical protein
VVCKTGGYRGLDCLDRKCVAEVQKQTGHTGQLDDCERQVRFDGCHFASLSAGPNQGSDTTKLPMGRHTFPFSFVLPPNLPSSFEGQHGYVRYSVKGVIDKPWKFDHSTKRVFTVICLLDLNTDPNATVFFFLCHSFL